MDIFVRKTFVRADIPDRRLPQGEYEGCRFMGLDLSGSDLGGYVFLECTFEACNLSLAKLVGTALRDVHFKECKMLGLQFDSCNQSGLTIGFEGCACDNSSFYKAMLRSTAFRGTRLIGCDFTECDLTGAVLEQCDLMGATFDHTLLERADLRTSVNYSIDPAKNKLRKARFSLSQVTGLLDSLDIVIDRTS